MSATGLDRNGDALPLNHVDPTEFAAQYLAARSAGASIEEAVGGGPNGTVNVIPEAAAEVLGVAEEPVVNPFSEDYLPARDSFAEIADGKPGVDQGCGCEMCSCDEAALFEETYRTALAPLETNMVEHPPHYNFGTIEVLDVLEDWNVSYMLGNVIKYVARSPHKGNAVEDLKKAEFYLKREIERLEREARS